MYYGKMTKKLESLYREYEEKWGRDPGGYEELEYGNNEYRDYARDIKKALELGVELPDIYPEEEDEF